MLGGGKDGSRMFPERGQDEAMNTDEIPRNRRALAGGAVASLAALGLISFPLVSRSDLLGESATISLVFGLTIAMGCGALLALFSLAGDHGRPPM